MSSSNTIHGFEKGTTPTLGDDPTLQLTRVFVYFLQNLFRDAPEGMGVKWSPNEETSEILITDQKPRLEAVEKKPHITCVFGAAQWGVLGLDQLQNQKMMSTGERKHTDLVSSTVSFHCQSREGILSRRIAWNVSSWTNIFRRVLMRGGGLQHVGMNHSISPESAPTAFTGPIAEDKIVSVVTTIPFYWQPQWLIRDPAVVWRRFSMQLRVGSPEARFSAGRAAHIRGAAIRGRPVQAVSMQPAEPTVTQRVSDHRYVGEE